MDESNIVLSNDDYEVVENAELLPDVTECFDNVPDVARPLIGNAERLFKRIERTLYAKGGIYTEMFDKQAKFYRDSPSGDSIDEAAI